MGKRKLSIRKIENDQYRMVSFSKRKRGLFKKAEELSSLTGAQTAVIVLSEAGRPYEFGSPSVDSILDQFLSNSEGICSSTMSTTDRQRPEDVSHSDGYPESLKDMLEADLGECKLEELLVLKKKLEDIRRRVVEESDLKFVDSLFV